jgi:hypothetical protein
MAELQPWGGDVKLPGWVRWLFRRPAPADTPERVHEARQPQYSDTSVLENADRAIFGAWSEGHPGNRPPRRR